MNSEARVMANGKLLERQLTNNRGQAETWQQRATDAVSTGDDDAARHALIRKKEQEKLMLAL
jgi:phage shock protein A